MTNRRRSILGAALLAVLGLAGLIGSTQVRAASSHHAARSMSLPGFALGPSRMHSEDAWLGYYDGHKDTYLNTDVSVKSQAHSLGINFAAALAHGMSASAPMYFVKGRAAAGQIAVFGSEPGESDYSPLWREVWVTWKAAAKPVVLTSDNQIMDLAKKGKLTMQMTMVILNAPIIAVGH